MLHNATSEREPWSSTFCTSGARRGQKDLDEKNKALAQEMSGAPAKAKEAKAEVTTKEMATGATAIALTMRF